MFSKMQSRQQRLECFQSAFVKCLNCEMSSENAPILQTSHADEILSVRSNKLTVQDYHNI